ncbi:MAG: saccharopine dehydrogenase NADP-binding domain-containing protein [Proteobacteria bacterium]|nr:saccharopine dehydrogenase NADP-binding domain-containing protein [Pseudomonadota bacterium]
MSRLLIYGANGYTGKLVAREAARRGLKPLLAGRNRDELDALAKELDLLRRVFELAHPAEIVRNLDGVGVVLHCAGPFSQTCAPMLNACLDANVHYLDITGEIDVFELCHRTHARAQHQGVVVLPGSGFDVVPTDCVAAMLKRKLPDANALVLAFEAGGGPSPGTALTSVEGLARGGRARIGGEVKPVPLAWKVREFLRDGKPRTAMTIPWGDVYTAHVSTGIANIETYMAVSPKTIQRLRWLRYIQPMLGLAPVQAFMKRRVRAATPGPSEQRRRDTGCHVWGEVRNVAGRQAVLELHTPNGYELTATAALGIAEYLLGRTSPPAGGYFTPSQLMGADYVLKLPGVRLIEPPQVAANA